jgi:phosphatidylserine decarboxylase
MILRLIHNDGIKFVAIFALIALLFWQINVSLGWFGILLTAWCIYFFRNPIRVVPNRKGLVVSPADGKIVGISKVIPPKDLEIGEDQVYKISIFLNVFDVHVNRIPFGGVIKKVLYHQGQFVNASLDKASDLNERNTLVIENEDGIKIAVVQIAGLIARRIRCDVVVDDKVETGQIYGLIRFGSRADIYLPKSSIPSVIVGQRAIAGETVLSDLDSQEAERTGKEI